MAEPSMRATIIGAGVAGLACAVELAERGVAVEVLERNAMLGAGSCSWYAGGMLAPWCELENAGALVARLGAQSIHWWRDKFPATVCNGTLVVAHARDGAELTHFARRTQHWQWVHSTRIAELEPDLAERFGRALFFASEACLDPRAALAALADKLASLGGQIRLGVSSSGSRKQHKSAVIIDCRGLAARDVLSDLRGVKGEMLLLRTQEISLARPVRVLHPRMPLYVVPRGGGLFMVGATMIESDAAGSVAARSVLELLSAAYALHPAFAEAKVIEISAQVRPAFADNLPHLRWRDGVLHVNGLYRHGFLLAPALARIAADTLLHAYCDPEVMDEGHGQRRLA